MWCSIGPVERVQQACATHATGAAGGPKADEGQGPCSLGAAVAPQSLSLCVCLHGILARGCGVCVESAPGCMAWSARYSWCALRPAFAYTVLGEGM